METKPKNRAWVKDAAIVFLVVLLLLTFFSNTIMNHSLPEVATNMVSNGTITAKVRGTGTVTANGNHKVKAKSNMTIGRVVVKAGQEVNAGDVLFVLGAADSTELEEAMIALEDLQTQYAQAALSVPLADEFKSQRNEVSKAYTAWQDADEACKQAEAEAKNQGESETAKKLLDQKQEYESSLATAQQQLDAQKQVLASTQTVLNEALAQYDEALKKWQREQQEMKPPEPETNTEDKKSDTGDGTNKQADGEVLENPLASVGTYSDDSTVQEPEYVKAARKKVEKLQEEYSRLETETVDGQTRIVYITNKQYEVNAIQMKLDAVNAQLSSLSSGAANLLEKQRARDDAWNNYEAKNSELLYAQANQNRSIASASAGLGAISNKIKRQQEKIKKLSGEGDENTITANVSGTVTEVNCTAGDSVVKDDILASIEVPDQGYTVSFSVTNDQAKRLHVGDTATISNYYWGNKIVATLATIQTDKKNPMTNKTLTFDLEGDVTSGSEITVSVGQKSANYDTIIPNSAIRTDSNGSFVLAVTAKNSPLGNRYIAKRVAIEVLAADDTNSAVTADLNNGDYVITTSSAPVASGDMVRLADAEN